MSLSALAILAAVTDHLEAVWEILRLDEDGKAIGATGQPGPGFGELGEAPM